MRKIWFSPSKTTGPGWVIPPTCLSRFIQPSPRAAELAWCFRGKSPRRTEDPSNFSTARIRQAAKPESFFPAAHLRLNDAAASCFEPSRFGGKTLHPAPIRKGRRQSPASNDHAESGIACRLVRRANRGAGPGLDLWAVRHV